MINLLPPKQKEEVFNEKKERTILTLMFFLVIFLLFSTTTFYITKYYSLKILENEKKVFAEEIDKLTDISKLEKDIEKLNIMVSEIDNINNQHLDLEAEFKKIKDLLPADLKVNNFDYKKNKQTGELTHQITLSGQASDWQSLLTFEESLEDNFSNVNFSEDSWAQVEDINFLVKFKINGENK